MFENNFFWFINYNVRVFIYFVSEDKEIRSFYPFKMNVDFLIVTFVKIYIF